MWRKFTVYGLRFSKTSFWNRINTGFLDPAVATVLTACGIETRSALKEVREVRMLQQCLPLAVLKHEHLKDITDAFSRLQQCLPLAVLKLNKFYAENPITFRIVATVLTACGIETNGTT